MCISHNISQAPEDAVEGITVTHSSRSEPQGGSQRVSGKAYNRGAAEAIKQVRGTLSRSSFHGQIRTKEAPESL